MANLTVLLLSAVLSASPPSETVLLQFTAQDCRPCQQMVPTVQRLEDEGFPIRPIDIDRNPQAARDWKVEAVPCFILVRDGREVDRVVGPASHDRLVRLFERAGGSTTTIRGDRSAGFAGEPTLGQGQVRAESFAGQDPRTPPRPPSGHVMETAGPPPTRPTDWRETRHGDTGTSQAESISFAASVRIRVNDEGGTSIASGTIIDTHGEEALVVTCGHLFRDSQGKGETMVELLAPGAEGRVVRGHVIEWDADDRDIALVAIRPGVPVTAAPVAASLAGIQRGAPVYSIGCNHGGAATLVRSSVAAVDRYTNAPNIVVSGQPVDGRSGGGLFSRDGELIGICNAADPTDDEGIYASLPTIHEQLARIGLARIYEGSSRLAAAPVDPRAPRPTMPAPRPPDDFDSVAHVSGPLAPPAPRGPEQPAGVPLSELITALENGHEVICIIRTPNAKEARVVFLDDNSRQLLSGLNAPRRPSAPPELFDGKTAARPVPTQWRN